jgi:hypothetical protein
MNLQRCVCRRPTPGHPWLPVPAWSPPPIPAASTTSSATPIAPCFQAMLQRLNFSNAPSPSMVSEPQVPSPRVVIKSRHLLALPPPVLPTREPISYRSRSRATDSLVLLTAGQSCHKCVTYHIPTAKSIQPTAEPIGFSELCKTMKPCRN